MYALKLELKLNNKERSYLAGCAGYSRLVYNYGLNMLKQSWSFEEVKASDAKRLGEIKKILTNSVMAHKEYEWMKKYPSTIYQSALQHLGNGMSRYRKGLSKLPVFKRKHQGDSFTVYKSSGVYPSKGQAMIPFTNRQVLLPGKKIKIPGLGTFRLKEQIPYICSSQTFTISREADKWFVSFMIDAEKLPPIIHENEKVGIDLGVSTFATLSNGKTYSTPPTLKSAKTKLSRRQWQNRNKQKGNRKQKIKASNNCKKHYQKLALQHAKIANQRKDFLQKTTTEISQENYQIFIEDLNVSGMLANHKLAEAIQKNGFYEFRRQLIYKQQCYGTKVYLVDRWYPSSKTCSCCGNVQPMKLSERTYTCDNCGMVKGRDENASINLCDAPLNKIRLA